MWGNFKSKAQQEKEAQEQAAKEAKKKKIQELIQNATEDWVKKILLRSSDARTLLLQV